MKADQIKLVQGSWEKVAPIAPKVAELFYNNLFQLDPTLKPLFKGDMKAQGKKLTDMITAAVRMLNNLDGLVPVLQDLGKRHVAYGVVDGHYATVGKALLMTLSQGLGAEYTAPVREAWTGVYGIMADVMVAASRSKQI